MVNIINTLIGRVRRMAKNKVPKNMLFSVVQGKRIVDGQD